MNRSDIEKEMKMLNAAIYSLNIIAVIFICVQIYTYLLGAR